MSDWRFTVHQSAASGEQYGQRFVRARSFRQAAIDYFTHATEKALAPGPMFLRVAVDFIGSTGAEAGWREFMVSRKHGQVNAFETQKAAL